eukprot:1159925-Pelagomonas_calceolata.AAC.2
MACPGPSKCQADTPESVPHPPVNGSSSLTRLFFLFSSVDWYGTGTVFASAKLPSYAGTVLAASISQPNRSSIFKNFEVTRQASQNLSAQEDKLSPECCASTSTATVGPQSSACLCKSSYTPLPSGLFRALQYPTTISLAIKAATAPVQQPCTWHLLMA